jgi:hypothetical protein
MDGRALIRRDARKLRRTLPPALQALMARDRRRRPVHVFIRMA